MAFSPWAGFVQCWCLIYWRHNRSVLGSWCCPPWITFCIEFHNVWFCYLNVQIYPLIYFNQLYKLDLVYTSLILQMKPYFVFWVPIPFFLISCTKEFTLLLFLSKKIEDCLQTVVYLKNQYQNSGCTKTIWWRLIVLTKSISGFKREIVLFWWKAMVWRNKL
jgi:hypothetical protein